MWGYAQRCAGNAITDNHNDSQRRPAVSESTAAWRVTCCASQPRALLAGPAAVLCTKVLHAAAAEPRSLVLSLADAAQVTPLIVSLPPPRFTLCACTMHLPS